MSSPTPTGSAARPTIGYEVPAHGVPGHDVPGHDSTGHDPEAMTKVLNRLKRAEGQLHALIESITAQSSCKDAVTQLSAVSKALDRAGYLIIANALQSCSTNADRSHDGMSRDDIEKLFLSLA